MAKTALTLALATLWLFPSLALAAGPSYSYRSTVLGNGISDRGSGVFEIKNEKYFFNEDESVHALTRIFRIEGINDFRFRYELRGSNYSKDVVSHDFRPNRRWWAEVYYWNDFGRLPTGDYELKVSVQVDGGPWNYRDNKLFRVGSPYSYDEPWYRPYDPYYRPAGYDCGRYGDCGPGRYDGSYRFEFTRTGRGVRDIGRYAYEITGETASFNAGDQVHALTKISNISRVDRFSIKHEVYADGSRYYTGNEVPVLHPRNQDWEYNYSWANLGTLPRGSHEIRSYIRVNDGSWRQLGTVRVTVGDGRHYDRPYPTPADYNYGWSKTGTEIHYGGGYDYEARDPKTEFLDNERVKALTRVSEIRGVRSIEVKHELYRGSSYVKNNSVKKYPNNAYWYYTYFQSDFGTLSPGDYSIKVYARVNDGSWKALDNVAIKVRARYSYQPIYWERPTYRYDGTIPYSDSYYGAYDYGYGQDYGDHYRTDANYRYGQPTQQYYDRPYPRTNYTYYYN